MAMARWASVSDMQQLASQVFLASQRAQAVARPFLHFGGIRTEETRAGRDAPIDDGEVQTDMVAFKAITPGAVIGRVRRRWRRKYFSGSRSGPAPFSCP